MLGLARRIQEQASPGFGASWLDGVLDALEYLREHPAELGEWCRTPEGRQWLAAVVEAAEGGEQARTGSRYNASVRLAELGEIALIERIADIVGRGSDRLLIGLGDDTAAWLTDGRIVLGTIDSQVENVHFRREFSTWRDVGWKSLAINLSDIAAMGGRPGQALIALSLPPDLEVAAVEELYRGLSEAASQYGATVAGGDIATAPQVTISIALLGTGPGVGAEGAAAALDRLLRRSTGQAGDVVAVTGALGASAAGLRALTERYDLPAEVLDVLRRAYVRPEPRLAEGQALVAAGVRTGMDVSDGLLIDLGRLARASGLTAEVQAEAVPIHPLVRVAYLGSALELALTGGEDYELLVAAPEVTIRAAAEVLAVPLTPVGRLTAGEPGAVVVRDAAGRDVTPSRRGWEHLRS